MCKICKALLTTKASSLGKTANSAIHHFDPSLDVENESSDEDEDSDSDEYDHGQHDETKNERP